MSFDHLIGKPFKDMGRGPDGYDCWGIIIAAGKVLGISVPDYGDFHYDDIQGISSGVSRNIVEWEFLGTWVDDPLPGTGILFKQDSSGYIHFGLCVGNGLFIHANKELGAHLARISHPFYRKSIRGFYRLRDK